MTTFQGLAPVALIAFGYLWTGLMLDLSDYVIARYNEKRRQSDKN
jgi:hypothetical protein